MISRNHETLITLLVNCWRKLSYLWVWRRLSSIVRIARSRMFGQPRRNLGYLVSLSWTSVVKLQKAWRSAEWKRWSVKSLEAHLTVYPNVKLENTSGAVDSGMLLILDCFRLDHRRRPAPKVQWLFEDSLHGWTQLVKFVTVASHRSNNGWTSLPRNHLWSLCTHRRRELCGRSRRRIEQQSY